MFLKEFDIRRYGPLAESGLCKLSAFNLFYGSNEDGKTLTIDALLKMLFYRDTKNIFKTVDRVGEYPEGYLVIRDDQEYKLPEQGTMENLFGFSARDFGRIFVIRDSDLSLADENNIYRNVTVRLTGIRTIELVNITNRIGELGQITPTGRMTNAEPDKLKERYDRMQDLRKEAEDLREELQVAGAGEIDLKLAALLREQEQLKDMLKRYEAASKRELYQRGSMALQRIKAIRVEQQTLRKFNAVDYDRWQEAEAAIKHLRNDRKCLEQEMERVEKVRVAMLGERQELTLKRKKVVAQLDRLRENILPLLDRYRLRQLKLTEFREAGRGDLTGKLFPGSLILFSLALAGSIFASAWWVYLILAAAGLVLLVGSGLLIRTALLKSEVKTLEKSLILQAASQGLPHRNLEEIWAAVAGLEGRAGDLEVTMEQLETNLNWQTREGERVKTELGRNHDRLEREARIIRDLQIKLGLDNPGLLKEKIIKADRLKNELANQYNLLHGLFPHLNSGQDGTTDFSWWEDALVQLQPFSEAERDLEYNHQIVESLQERLANCVDQAGALKKQQTGQARRLYELEKAYNELTKFEEQCYLPCQTMTDLETLISEIGEWIKVRDSNLQATLLAVRAVNKVISEEEEKVASLFGPDSAVSRYFREITGDRYSEVYFAGGDQPLHLVTANGLDLTADKISGGTFDQLYFTVRLVLGEKLLQGRSGFLILDDPFIKADPRRLKTLLEMLLQITDSGWQILYFSCKGEVRDLLESYIKAGRVEEFSIKPA